MFKLPELPYEDFALEPHISAKTISFHYGKHHQAYVDNLNKLIAGTQYENMLLPDIIKNSDGAIFNNAAQVWNHTFYWNCMKKDGGGEPTGDLLEAINDEFGSYEKFKEAFTAAAIGTFGSGWVWLVEDKHGELKIRSTIGAGNPMTDGETPLLVCDVWEHAYYIDYQNRRPRYVELFLDHLVNWEFVQSQD